MKEVDAYFSCLNLSQIWIITEPLRETDPNLERLTIRLHPAQMAAYKYLLVCFPSPEDREWLREQDKEVRRAFGLFLQQMYGQFVHKAKFVIDSTAPKNQVDFIFGDVFGDGLVGRIVNLSVPMGFE